MNLVNIKNFGPVKNSSIDLSKNFQVLIGAQASGKSTICKVIYFCQKIRDYTLDFLMDSSQFTDNHKNEYFNNYLKFLTKQFMGCFGKTTHMQKFVITYKFNDKKITIRLNYDGYVRFMFDDKLKNEIYRLIDNASDMFINDLYRDRLGSIIDNITTLGVMKRQLREALFSVFGNDSEIIYIPAGRSLLATMSEQLQDFSISDMDLTMQEFINLIRVTKSRFGSKIPEIVKNYTKTVKGQINNVSLEQGYELIKKIFKADYTSENDGEKIYYDENHWVKLMYGSSGQQEVLWILMLSFITILENRRSFIVIEEPEAHLFPIAQKDIINLISLLVNTTNSQVIITTHSPYILTSLNILLYSEKVENHLKNNTGVIIPKNIRIAYSNFAAYKVENSSNINTIESLLDEESHMISTDYIDKVSFITNSELDELLNMETGYDL
ncbi:AAA family ATPase [Hungatella hathewayi]|uniref:AAA family ATPase n=1 Tax=Hungatella hathewayi TaxID=154046 RepID=UPI003562C2F7